MTSEDEHTLPNDDEKALWLQQSLKYADDIAKIYEEEKSKRRALERHTEQLRREIAERKRTEQALLESEARFRAVFEAAEDYIYIKDPSLKYTHVNPAMARLFRVAPEDIVGKDDEDLYGVKTGLQLKAGDARVLGGQSIEEESTREVRGVPTVFLEIKFPLRNADNEITGICGIARDVTDRRRLTPSDMDSDPEYPSTAMQAVMAKARLAANRDSVVLLLGESGTGKDYLAQRIHEMSERRTGRFFSINCGSVAPELAESELFGHEPGAFTGAGKRKRGLLELAEGGTLFLNEIGELSPSLQAKLLTFLDDRSFTRVGGEDKVSVNARLIAATNRDLEAEAVAGNFRMDLYYRLNVLTITLPPLRARTEDIPLLVKQIVSRLQSEIRLHADPEFTLDAMEALQTRDWPGNVRELRNTLERALILSRTGKIAARDVGRPKSRDGWSYVAEFPDRGTLNDVTREMKKALVTEALRRSKGNRSSAARLLGISRNSFNHYLRNLDVTE